MDTTPTTIDAAELEDLRIDAAIGALALLLASSRRSGEDRRHTPRETPDRRHTGAQDLDAAREAWDRH
jgi:hypothetical protein